MTDPVSAELVGIVVVSHSRPLADAAVALASEMLTAARPLIAVAAGLNSDPPGLGTDAADIAQAIEAVDGPAGVVLLLDLGSALLSAEMALEFVDDAIAGRVVISSAPLVEGLVAALVTAAGGGSVAEVAAEAEAALDAKRAHLGHALGPVLAESTEAAADGAFTVRNKHGLHARPAARLVSLARTFDAQVQLKNPRTDTGAVSAASLSRVAMLGARLGDRIEVTASGRQARDAVAAILALAARTFEENDADPVAGPVAEPRTVQTAMIGAVAGIAIGPAFRIAQSTPRIPAIEPGDPKAQRSRLDQAIAGVRIEISRTQKAVSGADAAIFDAHLMLLDDHELLDASYAAIAAGSGAAASWDAAVRSVCEQFDTVDDSYLRARGADVRAVGDQVLRALLGQSSTAEAHRGVLLTDDLTPAQAAELDPRLVLGIVLASGSPTSHAAILARGKAIPMLVGAGTRIRDIPDGTKLIVDAGRPELIVDPAPDVLRRYNDAITALDSRVALAQAAAREPAVTVDGVTIGVHANVGSLQDAIAAGAADGAGLVRTEFLFHDRADAPGVDEQEAMYRAIADAFDGKPVVLRTLDAGGDKPLPFAMVEREANPFLGVRGLRLSLRHPELLLDQLTAICRVAADAPVSVMFPMVTSVAELRTARELLAKAQPPSGLRVGIMVEVPAVALKARAFLPYVDFFSVGTNDLAQYALAAERGNPALSALADPLDPGLLRLISLLCKDVDAQVPVSVCGELAGDPAATALLIGLGVSSLSMSAPSLAQVKQAVRVCDRGQAQRLASRALDCADATEVRALISESMRVPVSAPNLTDL